MDELTQLQQLLNELLQGIQDVLLSGEILTDDFQRILAQELEYLTSRIDELRNDVGGVTPTDSSEIPPAEHESSNINGFQYDPKTQNLLVKFQDKYPGQNGPIYSYQGVPPYIYDVFRRGAVAPRTSGRNAWHRWKEGVTPSHGAAMYALIKQGNFPYQRVS